uniref:Uncharacterized protein n=1 Tax=Candidatus Kentrum sp. FM TaxID=2126340 RepID=A0A450TCR7_9GAMM|nr:MAG: hypothetical protein BECKFM1743A_GA0114220_102773 [Candidatus Kentron sp. FM]VFJ64641.1 MAG: hypothetical protein BECKFM1743C_GA0114222_103743 [Candidatus Kentron sp. FM]VFK15001.1 MAG: hypothetical protein BECKFM1743B_GA0114221_103493 [Candidatus Kentron sp. FM]
MDKKSPFLAQFLARMSAFERENTMFLLVFHPVSADVIFWECTPFSVLLPGHFLFFSHVFGPPSLPQGAKYHSLGLWR